MVSRRAAYFVRSKLKLHRLKPDGIQESAHLVRSKLKPHRLKPDGILEEIKSHSVLGSFLKRSTAMTIKQRTERLAGVRSPRSGHFLGCAFGDHFAALF